MEELNLVPYCMVLVVLQNVMNVVPHPIEDVLQETEVTAVEAMQNDSVKEVGDIHSDELVKENLCTLVPVIKNADHHVSIDNLVS